MSYEEEAGRSLNTTPKTKDGFKDVSGVYPKSKMPCDCQTYRL